MPLIVELRGEWRLTRLIDDARAGTRAELRGSAILSPRAGRPLVLDYAEAGLLHLPGQKPIEARRRYVWRAAGAMIEVLFDDGRPFHVFDPAADASASHVCAPDTYDVRYDFTHWPDWRSTWAVRGPRKDYVMVSDYASP